MSELQFTKDQIEMLQHLRFYHSHPRVRRKMEVLWLKSQGVEYKQLLKLGRINGNTLRRYIKDFKDGGIEKLETLNFRKPVSELVKFKDEIIKDFTKDPPATTNEASMRIEKLTGIKRGLTQTRHFMKSMGFRFLKMGMIPAKADPEKQEHFKKKL
jgi:transposase